MKDEAQPSTWPVIEAQLRDEAKRDAVFDSDENRWSDKDLSVNFAL